ncbi:MAG: hypothetical protein RML73_08750 [Anaerolineae bacterium]|nr:hypothetical protein [Anaerolineae bacterium]
MSQVEQTLDRAYQLIENNQLGEAERLLQGLLPQHEANPDLWWLMAHATKDAKRGQEALNKVLSLAPERQDAKDILQSLGPAAKKQSRRPWLFPVLLVSALIVGFLLVALSRQPNPQPEATQVAQQVPSTPIETAVSTIDSPPTLDVSAAQATDEPTPTPEIVLTATLTPKPALSVDLLQADLPQITFAETALQVTDNATVVGICASLGPQASQAIDILLDYFSRAELDPSRQTFEISINDCAANLEVRAVAVDLSVLQAYGAGQIGLAELLRQLQPIR